MQTKEGHEAQSIVASEIAAMFDLAVFPTLRKHYEDNLEQHCRQVAQQLGLPEDRWADVHYPFYVSIDWDPRHAHMRKLMTTARLPPDLPRQQMDAQLASDYLGVALPTRKRAVHSQRSQAAVDQQFAAYEAALEQYTAENGVQFWSHVRYNSGLVRPWHRTLSPRQLAPVVKLTPDINGPAEHFVRSVKFDTRQDLLTTDLSAEQLKLGKHYQAFVRASVAKRGVVVDGRCPHVAGSVRKLWCTLKILAADAGTVVQLHHRFSANGVANHEVEGTGGAWIADTRWT